MKFHSSLPFVFLCCTIVLIFLNLMALMRLLPYLVTLPLLFLSIYLTVFTFFYRNIYRGTKRLRKHQ